MAVIWQKIIHWVIIPVISFFATKLFRLIKVYIWFKRTEAEMNKKTDEVISQANAAKTPEQQKEATENVIKNF